MASCAHAVGVPTQSDGMPVFHWQPEALLHAISVVIELHAVTVPTQVGTPQ